MAIICKYYKFGFCKFLSQCRKQHYNEECQEIDCNIENCPRRHPKICKYFEKYNRCKFGEYCAFAHRENPLVTEIRKLKIKFDSLAEDLNDKKNEVFDLKVKVEVLEKVVEEVVNRVESNHTPTKKNTKKRRKVRQTPSPAHEAVDEYEDPEEGILGPGVPSQSDQDSDQSNKSITAEEILKMYEGKE